MSHTILSVTAVPASGPGALPGFAAHCSCGEEIRSSLEVLARQWGREHAEYMTRKAAR